MAEGTDRARAWDLPAPGRKMNRRQSVVTGCSMSLDGLKQTDLVPELLPRTSHLRKSRFGGKAPRTELV